MAKLKCIKWNNMYQSTYVDQMTLKVKVKQKENKNEMEIGDQTMSIIFFGIFNIKINLN